MARRKKSEPGEGFQLPPKGMAILLGVFALLAFVGGVGILWQTMRMSQAENLEPRLNALRGDLAGQISKEVERLRVRLDEAVDTADVRAVAAEANFDAVAEKIKSNWSDLDEVTIFDPSLEEAFAADIAGVGYGKLALISSAASQQETLVNVVGSGNDLKLGMAAAVGDAGDGTLLAVVYGAVPMAELTAPVQRASIGRGFLELRSGQRALIEKGSPDLRQFAAYTEVEGIPLRLGTAAPKVVGTLPYSATTQMVMGLGLLLFSGLFGWKLRKLLPTLSGSTVDVAPTLAEALEQAEAEPAEGTKEAATAAAKERIAEKLQPEPEKKKGVPLNRSIFRAYDIRGVLGETLDEGIARSIGQAIGTVMAERGLQEIVVGRDGRLSGPALSDALIEGLRLAGRDVIDIGLAPSPVVYFANYQLQAGSCVAVTGSHNPPDYNGFKIVIGDETLSGEAIEDLYLRIADGLLDDDGGGGLQAIDVSGDYISRIADDIQLEQPLKVVVDAGNGVAGGIAPQVLEAIGAEVVPLYCEVDGEFPNHHPDPSNPENLSDLITLVKEFDADLGLAFDGDGDRLGVVTKQGEIIYPDRLLMLFARDVLSRNPGATVIYDVKCTGHLAGQVLRSGGSPVMWKTGHSLIKAKMRETGAELAGEMSGHFFFQERWYGFDDGIYSAARLLEILAADGRSAEEVFAELPKGYSTPELKVEMEEGEHYAFIDRFVAQAEFADARISTIDGIRADWEDGWGLVRCSNTTPSLVLRFDADSQEALARIQESFRNQLMAVDPGMELPF